MDQVQYAAHIELLVKSYNTLMSKDGCLFDVLPQQNHCNIFL